MPSLPPAKTLAAAGAASFVRRLASAFGAAAEGARLQQRHYHRHRVLPQQQNKLQCHVIPASLPSSSVARGRDPQFLRRSFSSLGGAGKEGESDAAEKENSQPQQQQQENRDATAEPDTGGQLEEAASAAVAEAAEAQAKIASLQDQYIRCLADMENLRTRTRNEVEQAKQFAIQKFAKDLLETTDVLRMALSSIPKSALRPVANNVNSNTSKVEELSPDDIRQHLRSLHEGVSLMETELLNVLRRNGVEKFDAIGQPFDPNRHQAMFQAPVPGNPVGTVFAVQKTGFTLNGRVIRPAQVGVVKEE